MSHHGHRPGSSPVHRYLNGRILDQQNEEPDATTGLLQHVGSGAEDDDDGGAGGGGIVAAGAMTSTTADDRIVESSVSRTGNAPSSSAAGCQLNASGTEISLDGQAAGRATHATVGSAASVGGGGGSGKPAGSSTASLKTSWKIKYQDFLPDKKGTGAAKFDPVTSEHFQ